jgi:predicted transposase/invertase (TIGR01784 family)
MKMAMRNFKITPAYFLAFAYLFGSNKNKELWKHFIMDFTNIKDVEDVKIETPYSVEAIRTRLEDGKNHYMVNDAVVTDQKGRTTLVEMQNYFQDFLLQRMFYATSNRYIESIGDGKTMEERYGAINDVVGIVILNEGVRFLKNETTTQPLFHYEMKETIENGEFIGPTQHIFVVKLGDELSKQYPNLHHWINFFVDGKVDKDAPQYLKGALDMLAKKTWNTEEEKIMAQAREDDYQVQAYIESAELLGMEKKKIEIAKKLLATGADLSFVCDITGLSEDEVKKLLK